MPSTTRRSWHRITQVLLLAAVVGVALLLARRASEPAPPPDLAAPPVLVASVLGNPLPAARLETLRIATGSLGRGATLGTALERLSVTDELAQSATAALAPLLELRRLPAETGLAVGRDEHGTVRTIGVRAERERFVRLRFAPGPTAAVTHELVELPVQARPTQLTGVIESSVDQAISHSDHGGRLTLAFADIFQWDVDLLVDPRPGDRVRVVFESRAFGELPPDLPPFAGRVESSGATAGLGRILAATYDGAMARSTAYWVEAGAGKGGYYDAAGAPLQKTFLKSPLSYRRISSRFSSARKHPITRKVVPHHGVDFAAPSGTPVVASADGRVTSVGWDGPLGQAVRVRHGSRFTTVYGHLSSFARGVRAGVEVRQNQVIGYVGATGRATGPHLHYTLIDNGRPIDPLRFDNPPAAALEPELHPLLAQAVGQWSGWLASPAAATDIAAAAAPPGAGPGS